MKNYIFYIILAALCAIALAIIAWCGMPDKTQEKFKHWLRTHLFPAVNKWLLIKVQEAEEALGSGTGEAKLRMVYDAFAVKFKWLYVVMPFALFKALVDDALDIVEERLK